MAQLELRDSLCGDLLRLALSYGNGKLEHQGMLAIGVRAALLLDLVAVGRIERDETGALSIDPAPTGCWSADDLVTFAVRYPNYPLTHVLRRGRPHLAGAVRELVVAGYWAERRRTVGLASSRFTDKDGERFFRQQHRISQILRAQLVPRDGREALLAALAAACALMGRDDDDAARAQAALRHVDRGEWLAAPVVSYLEQALVNREIPLGSANGAGG